MYLKVLLYRESYIEANGECRMQDENYTIKHLTLPFVMLKIAGYKHTHVTVIANQFKQEESSFNSFFVT